MAKTISKNISVKASSAKPSGKPLGKHLPGDTTIGVEAAIRFYATEDNDDTEEV